MITLHIVLLLIGFACFVAAALGVPSRVNWTGAGLACWVLSLLV